MSYLGHSLEWKSYPSAGIQSIYSTVPAIWTSNNLGQNWPGSNSNEDVASLTSELHNLTVTFKCSLVPHTEHPFLLQEIQSGSLTVPLKIRVSRLIDLVCRVFPNGPGDQGSIPGRVIPKTLKMVLCTYLLNTQQYKVRIKGKVEQPMERSSALPYTLMLLLLKKEPSGRPRIRSPILLTYNKTNVILGSNTGKKCSHFFQTFKYLW